VRAAAILLIIGLAFEVTTRVEDWIRFRTPFLSPYRSQMDLFERDDDGIRGRPGARFGKWIMNNLGTRGPEVSVPKPAHVIRVAALGASETFGLYESPDREFPRQLEGLLQRSVAVENCPPVVRRFEVINAAIPGMSLPTVTEDVSRRIRRFDADIVVYYPSPAQYLELELPQPSAPGDQVMVKCLPVASPLYPRLIRRVVDQVKLLVPSWLDRWGRQWAVASEVRKHPASWRFETLPADRLAAYERDLRRLVEAIRAIGAEPVLATHANAFDPAKRVDRQRLAAWESFYPRASGSTILQFDAAAREVTRRVADDLRVTLAETARTLDGQTDKFADFAHFTDEGAAIVASELAPAVLATLCPGQRTN
jgi:hypothetical protein